MLRTFPNGGGVKKRMKVAVPSVKTNIYVVSGSWGQVMFLITSSHSFNLLSRLHKVEIVSIGRALVHFFAQTYNAIYVT